MNEREIFTAASQLSDAAERDAFLVKACAGDPDLRGRIVALLEEQAQLGSFLEHDPPARTLDHSIAEAPGAVVGPYKLMEEIGEGGFGLVFVAEQHEPVRRKVALKILKPGMDTRQVIARFEAERQALAIMDHPNIAKVFDGGATPSGRPYFVMELVKGTPITQFCDENRSTPRQRLELFVDVCAAVQHAHQKGIIHRDLKPSNVLVTSHDGKPVVKVIDFGVAKAVGGQLTDMTVYTQLAQLIGTPLYMSPEQAGQSGLDIDTRSDIYSLGVLLYELLTGTTPFAKERFKQAAYDEIRRIIREEEPPKPSTRLSDSKDSLPSISAQRHTEPAKLTRLVRGELDWIVMKALEKDRNRRYETANGFAMDVQRYLADEPVQACPPSAGYRLRKFARRNKGLLVSCAVVAVALVLGIVGTTWQAIRATNASETAATEAARANREAARASSEAQRATAFANQAQTEAAIAKAVNDFLNEDLLLQARPDGESDREVKLRTLVERAAKKIDSGFREQPLVEAAIRQTLANIYLSLGDSGNAEAHCQRAVDLRHRHLGPEEMATLVSMTALAHAFNIQKRHVEAEKLHRETFEIKKRVLGPEHPSLLENMTGMANSMLGLERLVDAEKLHREIHDARRRLLGPDHPHTLLSKEAVATCMARQGRHAEAEKLLREMLASGIPQLKAGHPILIAARARLAIAVRDQGRLPEAEDLFREVYELRKRVLGPEHRTTKGAKQDLTEVIKRQGRHEKLKPQWEEALTHSRQGIVLHESGRAEQAAERFRKAIALLEPLAEEFFALREYREQLGKCYIWLCYATKDSKERTAVLVRAQPLWQKLAEEFPKEASIWSDLGETHAFMGDWHKTVDTQTRALELNADYWPASHRRSRAYMNLGQWKAAIADLTRALELNPKHWASHWHRGESFAALKQWDRALLDFEQAINLGATAPKAWVDKAGALAQLKQPHRAIAALREAVSKGFRRVKTLHIREDLAPLRERDEFKQFLKEVTAKKK